MLFQFFADYNDTIGSPSPWDSIEESGALDDMASSSENKSRLSGWTSSDNEADIMDQDDEGLTSSVFYVSILCFRFLILVIQKILLRNIVCHVEKFVEVSSLLCAFSLAVALSGERLCYKSPTFLPG